MENETFDGEPIIMTDENRVTIAVWNHDGLAFIVQVSGMGTHVLDSFQQNDRGKWIHLTKRVNFHATVCRKLDTYRLDGGLLKINWANDTVLIQGDNVSSESNLLMLCSILIRIRSIK